MKNFLKTIIGIVVTIVIILVIALTVTGIIISNKNNKKINSINELVIQESYTDAYNTAQQLVESGMITNKKKAIALYNQSICLFMKNQKDSALQKLRIVYKLNPDFDRLSDIDEFNTFFEDYKKIKAE